MAAFIAFEGGELTGKSTQSNLLNQRMNKAGYKAVLVKEPGTTPLGNYLREYVISDRPISYEAELLLFAAARAELVKTKLQPTLQAGINVISDRYMYSSVAYQGYGRGLKLADIDSINKFATQGCIPDLVILVDLPPETSLKRLRAVQGDLLSSMDDPTLRSDEANKRKFERMSLSFHEKIRNGFLSMAKKDPDRWFVVDGGGSIESIAAKVWERVEPLLKVRS